MLAVDRSEQLTPFELYDLAQSACQHLGTQREAALQHVVHGRSDLDAWRLVEHYILIVNDHDTLLCPQTKSGA
jgi:hypothetical protein